MRQGVWYNDLERRILYMLSSPDLFIEEHENDSYEELVKLKNELIREIDEFERTYHKSDDVIFSPSPETYYQWNISVLEKLLPLLKESYRRKYEEDE